MKIIYYYSQLNIGGAERSTVRLLNKFVENNHDVTLLLRWSGGSIENLLSPKIKRIYLKQSKANGSQISNKFSFCAQTIFSLFRLFRLNRIQYDVCISGLLGYNPSILFKRIKAKQYYQLMRNDVKQTSCYGKTEKYIKKYGDRFDAYIGVSKYTTESFCEKYPALSDRALTIYNIIEEKVDEGSINPFAEFENKIKILTVCRLADKAKGLFRMIDVCTKLREEYGKSFVWYVVGDGPDKESMRERISEKKLEDQMILCGEQSNPFPYYKNADLVAVLSYYEGLCGVVNESKIMKRPVIATEFSGIHEQITNGVNGLIVDNNEAAIIEGMSRLICNKPEREAMAINGMPEELINNEYKIRRYEDLYKQIESRKANG